MENLSPFFDTLEWVVKNTWPMLALFIAIICVVRISSSIINHEKFVFYKDFYSLLAIIYFLLLLLVFLVLLIVIFLLKEKMLLRSV